MSNDFGDFEDDDIELEPSEGHDFGFEFDTFLEVEFLDDDALGSDSIAMDLFSSGSWEDNVDLDGALLLDYEDVDVEGTVFTEQKYEVSTTPAQTALALYKPDPEESFLIETASREIHNSLHNIRQYGDNANKKIREYLDTSIFDILPKGVRFKSVAFNKQQDFRSMLISEFNNHRSLPNEYTKDHIIDKVLLAYKEERLPELEFEEVQELIKVISNFILFANSTFNEAERQQELVEYKEFPKKLECPEVVGNFTYVCRCGTEYEMPNNRPTLTFYIKEQSKSPVVRLMNIPIPCETCKVYLTLPTPLVVVLESNMQDYINNIRATYEEARVYRPKLEDLIPMIPSDVQDLFQLAGNKIVESDSQTKIAYSEAISSYTKLINMWMNNVSSQDKLNNAILSFEESTEFLPVIEQLTLVDFGFVADLYSYQFTKTVIHYLEGFSCFSLTHEKEAFHRYCEIEDYNKQAFPVGYAKQWIYDNAAYIASLNNIYTGDTKMSDLGILPEYLEALNYVLSLHLLSKPELLKSGSDLAKWIKAPSSSLKVLERLIKKQEPATKNLLVTSHRNLVNSNTIYEQKVWSDTYLFIRTIVSPNRHSLGLNANMMTLATKAQRSSETDFYEIDVMEDLMVRPTLMFNEFMTMFKDFGYLLFTGAIVDEVRKNLAKGIELFRKGNKLDLVFKSNDRPVNDISNILLTKSTKEIDSDQLLFELIIKSGDLPGDLNNKRDEIGHKDILANIEEYRDDFTSDEVFMRKYGEIVKCFL